MSTDRPDKSGDAGADASGQDDAAQDDQHDDGGVPEPADPSSRDERGGLGTEGMGGGGDDGGGGGGLSAKDIGEAMMAAAEKLSEERHQEMLERLSQSNEMWQEQVDEWERAMRTRLD